MNNPPTALVGFGERAASLPSRLSMNDPPTALVGFGGSRAGWPFPSRLSMNDPPTALVGFRGSRAGWPFPSRLSMNDPPTALVGLGDESMPNLQRPSTEGNAVLRGAKELKAKGLSTRT